MNTNSTSTPPVHPLSTPLLLHPLFKPLLGFLLGLQYIQIGFVAMHDASHFACSTTPLVNWTMSSVWQEVSLWSHPKWTFHHCVRHHAYTGDALLDPDVRHAKPFIRKSPNTIRKGYVKGLGGAQQTYASWCFVLFCLFPGMFVGQTLSYSLIWPLSNHLWRLPFDTRTMGLSKTQVLVKGLVLSGHVVFHYLLNSLATSLLLVVGLNLQYALCILPDHDVMEVHYPHLLSSLYSKSGISSNRTIDYSSSTSSTASTPTPSIASTPTSCNTSTPITTDWGEIQVRHSANFANTNKALSALCGGINFQIEHHLFPGMSHVHLQRISPLVQRTCEEFGLPYNNHVTLSSALYSFVTNVTLCMDDVLIDEMVK